ncbi:SusD/RagB family nutrient-binding outer membrane lipoprotein [Aquimarina muelleri]|nr:SusD/RagB family nutrient-binding outer membrane lipoprotein [Aquimarina muelleri]MCX2762150.1 SusD/RagB family nutrient-binding outer membrane lipoprotein [Aquimarina muelleri]
MKKYNITNTIFKYFTIPLVLIGLVIVTNSCETTELDLLDNPSRLQPDQASEDLFVSGIQLGLTAFFDSDNTDNFNGANELGMQVTRMIAMTGGTSYQNAYTPADLNGMYADAYTGVMIDIRTLIPLAEEKGLYTHLGIAQVSEAYIMMTLVDYFGDFPYEEAFLGSENTNPGLTPGKDIYTAIEQLLIDAIVNFNKEESADVANDFFYGGDESKWIKLANTLRLKSYLQTRLVDANAGNKITAIVTEGNYIQSSADDFQFNYSTTDVNPDSRHPLFGISFDNGPLDYVGNWYMNALVNQKNLADANINDPRRRYYIYRQETDYTAADEQKKPCISEDRPAHYSTEETYCNSVGSGYWGRDHGDDDGLPPDDALRTLFGVYPVGGPFDNDSGANVRNRNVGLRGAGSSMIMLSSYVQFMLAEAALTTSYSGDARAHLDAGIAQSITKVLAFGQQLPADEIPSSLVPSASDITTYKDAILEKYDAPGLDDDAKLDIIIEQYFLALWQNGVEAYNTYRRTGKPDLQPTLLATPGVYIRTFPYPDALVNRNSSVDSKPISTQVFWDTNPANFID